MEHVLRDSNCRPAQRARRLVIGCLVVLAALGAAERAALAQGYPGGGQMPGGRGMGGGGGGHTEEMPSAPAADKPDAAARKAFAGGVKSLKRAQEFEEVAAKATNPDKKAAAMDKVGDAYNKALDQFTEALSNKGDMVEAWNDAGYVHLRLGAYNEAIDDYNHTLALKAGMLDAVEHRAEAYMAVDRLDQAKAAYMDLFNHARPLADQLMVSMQKWLAAHRASAAGIVPADIDSFGKWLEDRDGIAKQTAAASAANPQ